MGTTVTSNHGLIKPDQAEEIRKNLPTFPGWAEQNKLNCDKLDALFRATTHTWTPAWTASSNPTLGAGGFIEGKYIRIYPRMVVGYFRIYTGGAGFATGSGGYRISVPVPIAAELAGFLQEVPIGRAGFYDDSAAATSSMFTVMYSISGGTMFMKLPLNDSWTDSNPVVLAQQDRLTGYFMYPTSTP